MMQFIVLQLCYSNGYPSILTNIALVIYTNKFRSNMKTRNMSTWTLMSYRKHVCQTAVTDISHNKLKNEKDHTVVTIS